MIRCIIIQSAFTPSTLSKNGLGLNHSENNSSLPVTTPMKLPLGNQPQITELRTCASGIFRETYELRGLPRFPGNLYKASGLKELQASPHADPTLIVGLKHSPTELQQAS